MNQSKITAYIYLALAQSMVGYSIVGSKYLVNHIDYFHLLAIRFAVGTLVIYSIAKIMHPKIKFDYRVLTRTDWFFMGLQALTAGFFFNILLLLGLKYTSATIAGILTSTLPAIIFIFSFIFLKEKLTRSKLECILLAMIGLAFINYKNMIAHHHTSGSTLIGNLIVMLALIPEASFYIVVKIHRSPLPPAVSGTWIMLINALSFLPMALFRQDLSDLVALDMTDLMLIATLGGSSGMFYVFWSLGAKQVETSTASLFTAVMPISTLLIARVALGETLGWFQILGMGFIIFSIFVSTGAIKKYTKNDE